MNRQQRYHPETDYLNYSISISRHPNAPASGSQNNEARLQHTRPAGAHDIHSHRSSSKQPRTSGSNARSSRHHEGGSTIDSSRPALMPFISSTLKRKKSSGSASTSTAVTALSSLEDEFGTRNVDRVPLNPAVPPSARAVVSLRRLRTNEDYLRDVPETHGDLAKKDKGKAVTRSQNHPNSSQSVRRNDLDSVNDSRVNKHHDVSERQYSGQLAQAEFDRMRREIEHLKKSVHDAKKNTKKQSKKTEELKSQLLAETLAKDSYAAQVQALKTSNKKSKDLIVTIENSLQCQICMDLIHRPYALSPCGHMLCLHCLQEWFRKAPPSADDSDMDPDDEDDPQYILGRTKSCPCCRAVVKRRPVPVFMVKSVVAALTSSDAAGRSPRKTANRSPSPARDADPWKGLFRLSEDEDDDDDDDGGDLDSSDDDIAYPYGWALQSLNMGLAPRTHRRALGNIFGSSSSSASDDEDEDGEDDDVEDDESLDGVEDEDPYNSIYVSPRWEPPSVTIDPADYEGCFADDEEEAILTMLRRGCTYDMIQAYQMEYSHSEGLIAYLYSLDDLYVYADEDEDGATDRSRTNRIFLGWNIKLDEADAEGEVYMQLVLNSAKENRRQWDWVARVNVPGSYDVKRLVRLEDVEDYDTTDTEVWLDANDPYL